MSLTWRIAADMPESIHRVLSRFAARHVGGMRVRDHNKGDLALTALTLTVAAAAAANEAARWAARRHRRRPHSAQVQRPTSK
ncbi:hypothetical protein GCM10009817_17150 [Terrabacter lapilli]|uniref:Uncharacterized protein n=1 Tax=Terrabacter lapilli TaxID=436231 RepID=A0ABN2RYV9_9MICO